MQIDILILYIAVIALGVWVIVGSILNRLDHKRIWSALNDDADDISQLKNKLAKVIRAFQIRKDKESRR